MTKFKTLATMLLAVSCLGMTAAHAQTQPQTQEQIVQNYDQTQKNKEMVMKAYQALFGDHDLGALDVYWSDQYIQHNPQMADGKQGVRDFMTQLGILNSPKQQVTFVRVIAENDLVMLQTRSAAFGGNPEVVYVDIFRVENDKIVEHWDVIQAVPADKTNPRPLY